MDEQKLEESANKVWKNNISPEKFVEEYNKLLAEDDKEPKGFEPHEHI